MRRLPLILALLSGCSGAYFEAADPRFNHCDVAEGDPLGQAFDEIKSNGYQIRAWEHRRWETNTVRRIVWVGNTDRHDDLNDATAQHEATHVRQSKDSGLMLLAAQPRYQWAIEVQGVRQAVITLRVLGWGAEEIEDYAVNLVDHYGWSEEWSEDAVQLATQVGCR